MDLQEKFAAYETCDNKATELKAELEKALKEKSEAVRAIATEIAPKKKIIRDGKKLTVVVRGNTYFFKGEGKGEDDTVEI